MRQLFFVRGFRFGKAKNSFRYIRIYWLFHFIIVSFPVAAQPNDSLWIDVAKIRFTKTISDKCLYTSTPAPSTDLHQIPHLPYAQSTISSFYPNVPRRLLEETAFLQFFVYNSADTSEPFCFTPGFYFRNLRIYKASPGNVEGTIAVVPDSTIQSAPYAGSRLFKLEPGERAIFFASFDLIRTNTNNFRPTLIEKDFLPQWVRNMKHRDHALDTITYIISGILLLMIFYSLAVYLQNRNREFLYYAVYAFCSAVLLFLKSLLIGEASEFNFVYEEYLDLMLLGVATYFYLIFIRKFINTRQSHPFLEKFLKFVNVILIGLLSLFTAIYIFTNQYASLYILENYIIKIFLFVIGIVFITYSFRKKDTLLNYLAAGNFSLLVFSIMSLAVIFGLQVDPYDRSSILNKGLLYYELGVVLELVCFLMGLAYKNRHDLIERVKERERLKLLNERQEFEKQMAVMAAQQEERDRISADMHDELGSGVTAIRLMSEIVKTKIKGESFPELERISNSANDLLGKMNTIIWTMKSSNDSLESLVAYLRSHALEYFENTPISCHVEVPETIPDADMSGEKRRNIFLSVKEALNNVMKHSHATQVSIAITIQSNKLLILVRDNGVGIDTEKLRRFGNGLSNMKRRMESINGEFMVENLDGSKISFIAPV